MTRLAPLACVGLLLALAGCSGGTTAGHRVDLVDNNFQPTSVRLAAGEAIHFQNKGSNTHSVTIHDEAGSLKLDRTLNPGESVDFTFAAKGEYHVFCKFHDASGMAMAVIAT